eukprot:403359807
MIYKDICKLDELGATLKLYIVTEIYLQIDAFKMLNKQKVLVLHKTLVMLLQEREMRLLLGPRALQSLALLLVRNSKARKIHSNKQHHDMVKEFVNDYRRQLENQTEDNQKLDQNKLIRVVLTAKQILHNDEFNQIVEDFGLEKNLSQFNDFDSLTFFISRIPLRELMSIFKDRDDLIQSSRPLTVQDVGKNHQWLDQIKQLSQTQYNLSKFYPATQTVNCEDTTISSVGTHSELFKTHIFTMGDEDNKSFINDSGLMIGAYQSLLKQNSKDDGNSTINTETINNANFDGSPHSFYQNITYHRMDSEDNNKNNERAEFMHNRANNNGGCCAKGGQCIIF